MVQVRHKKFRGYSGPSIYGAKFVPNFQTLVHLERAVILTEGVETGYRIGSVFAADGTAMTAGRGQHVLVYPKELAHEDFNAEDDQGGLSKLLRKIELNAPNPDLDNLLEAFEAERWYLARDGFIRWTEDSTVKVGGRWIGCEAGALVHGAVLRNRITPNGGKVPAPKDGPDKWQRARKWALLFHAVFDSPLTHAVQLDFEVEHLVERIINRKYVFHDYKRKETVLQVVYGGADILTLNAGNEISDELDLAMCALHSHSVNAPAIALRKLKEAIKITRFAPNQHLGTVVEIAFARELLRRLATATYGRWNDSIENGRWARTRARARESGMWPAKFFKGESAIMPVSF